MQKVFSEKLDIKLIKQVKEHPELYDNGDPKYMDFNAREVAWQKIGDALEKPAADCKVRWINIRDVHRRILRKSLSGTNPPKRAYKYDKHLDFVKTYYKEVVSVSNEESGAEEETNKAPDTHWNELIEFDNDSSEAESKPVMKRKRKTKQSFEAVEVPEAPANEPSELDVSDPVDAFLISIGATLKKFSPYHLNLAKSKIFHIVQEHDLQQIVERQPRSEAITLSTEAPMYYQG